MIISKIGWGFPVGAALRADRSPTRPPETDALEMRPYHKPAPRNMGVAQLASHSLHYLNFRSRPIFSFPAASAAAVTPEACPYQRTPW